MENGLIGWALCCHEPAAKVGTAGVGNHVGSGIFKEEAVKRDGGAEELLRPLMGPGGMG